MAESFGALVVLYLDISFTKNEKNSLSSFFVNFFCLKNVILRLIFCLFF